MMKSKIKKHVFGYDVFKENIPFSKLDEGDVVIPLKIIELKSRKSNNPVQGDFL